MTDQTTAPPRRKTEQALKLSVTWTPSEATGAGIMRAMLGDKCPLVADGGRLIIRAAFEAHDKETTVWAHDRADELVADLAETGKIHSTTRHHGSVPAGEAELMPRDEDEQQGEAA